MRGASGVHRRPVGADSGPAVSSSVPTGAFSVELHLGSRQVLNNLDIEAAAPAADPSPSPDDNKIT